MAEYIDRELVKKDHQRWLGYLDQDMIDRMNITIDDIPTADVVERSKIDKAVEEIKDLYDEWENISEEAKLESNPFGAVLNITQRNIGE